MAAALACGFAAVSWAYATSFRGVFVFDDIPAIVNNEQLRTLPPHAAAFAAPPGSSLSGRPVAALSFALNYAVAPREVRDRMGPGPPGSDAESEFLKNIFGYHLANVAIHVMAALLLFGVVRRTLRRSGPSRFDEGTSRGLAAATAVLWAVHPLHTGSVTYLIQRVEVLMGFFYLLTLYCVIRRCDGDARAWWWGAAAAGTCALGMATKEVMVTAPIIIAIWMWLFDRVRLGIVIGLSSTWVVLGALAWSNPEVRAVLSGVGLDTGVARTGPVWEPIPYLLTQAEVLLHYLRLSLVPAPLVIDYYGWVPVRSAGEALPSLLAVGTLFIATVAALRRRWPPGFLGAWFFIILAPTSSVVPIGTEVAAEHRMYLPLAAVIASLVTGAYGARHLVAWVIPKAWVSPSLSRSAVWLLAGVLAAGSAVLTRERNRDYWSELELWSRTVHDRPDNARARINYGIELMKLRQFAEAETQMRIALNLQADRETLAQVHLQLGASLCAQRRCSEGLPQALQAQRLDPSNPEVPAIVGEAFFQQGDLRRARDNFIEAAARKPDDVRVLNRVAWFLATVDDPDLRDGPGAVRLAERAVQLTNRQDPVALDSLAVGHAASGQFDRAAEAGQLAVELAERQGRAEFAKELSERLAYYLARR